MAGGNEGIDLFDQRFDRTKARSAQRLCGKDVEQDFDLIELGGVCLGEMKVDVCVGSAPHLLLDLRRAQMV